MENNVMYLNGIKYYVLTEEELEEQKMIAIMEHNIAEIKAGRRTTIPLEDYKKELEERHGRKIFD